MPKRRKSLFRINKEFLGLIGGSVLFLTVGGLPQSALAFFSKDDRGADGPALLKMEPGVRPLSMGGAYVGMADDSNALFWNPAGLQRVARPELLLGHSRLFEDQTQHHLGLVRPVWRRGERKTWGLSASYLAVDSFELVKEGVPAGTVRPWEGMLGLSYAGPWRTMSWGVTGRMVQKELAGLSGQSYGMDAGLMGKSQTTGTHWGIVVANLGTTMDLGGGKIQSPLVIRLGASQKKRVGSQAFLRVAGQLDVPKYDVGMGRIGAEWVLPRKEWAVALRAGALTSNGIKWSAGAGVERGPVGINFAFSPNKNVGVTQRLDMVFRFGSPLKQETNRQVLLNNALSAWSQGRAAQAAEALEEIALFSPKYYPAVQLSKEVHKRIEESLQPETLFNLGTQSFAQGDYEHATVYFRKLVVLDPQHPEAAAMLKRSQAKLSEEMETQAREDLKRGRDLERRSLYRSVREDQRLERWESALKGWRRVLSQFPKDKEALAGVAVSRDNLRRRAVRLEAEGDRESAISIYAVLQEDNPDRDVGLRIEQLKKNILLEKTSRAQDLYRRGVRAYSAGELSEAYGLFEEAAQLNPSDSTVVRARDRVRSELKSVPRAP